MLNQPKHMGMLFFAVVLMFLGVWQLTTVEVFTPLIIGLGIVWAVVVIGLFLGSQRGLHDKKKPDDGKSESS